MSRPLEVLNQLYDEFLARAEQIQSLRESIDWDSMTPADEDRIWRLILELQAAIKTT